MALLWFFANFQAFHSDLFYQGLKLNASQLILWVSLVSGIQKPVDALMTFSFQFEMPKTILAFKELIMSMLKIIGLL